MAALRGAGEDSRLRILRLLADGELAVGEIVQILGQSQPRVSRHLKVLVDAGLVERFREGAWSFHRLADSRAGGVPARVAELLANLDVGDDPVFEGDALRLAEVKAARAEEAQRYFAEHADRWDQALDARFPHDAVASSVRRIVGGARGGRLIDLGAGTGRLLVALKDLYSDAVGVDLSPSMLRVARANLEKSALRHAQMRQGDLFALPFGAAQFDMAILHQVLRYLADPGGAVAAAARLLKTDGRLFVIDFAPHEDESLRNEHGHRRLGFGDEEMARFFVRNGLDGVATETVGRAESDTGSFEVRLWCAKRVGAARDERQEAA